ncbi:MAG: outer membrane protein transport protein [Sphingorhabdus sp.]
MHNLSFKAGIILAAAGGLAFSTTAAHATEGYFANGAGARSKAVAGAGAADSRDATAIAINPAGLAGVDTELDISLSLFSPNRRFTGTGGPGFTPNTVNKSDANYFPIPNVAFNYRLDDTSSIGFSIIGNGGMNTKFTNVPNPACVSPPLPANNGVFCGGETGVNLLQMLITVAYAKDFGPVKIGVAPILAHQRFKANGLLAFGGVTSNPAALTNNGVDGGWGFGARVGIELEPVEGFRIGAAYQTKIKMSKFDKYAGLFEGGGSFDIPSSFQIGVAADVTPNLTIMADYRHIKYSDVPAISNSSGIMLPFGADGGPGFGWNNVNTYKIGAEYRSGDKWTLRAGYAHNSQPVNGADVTLNILAPGVVTDHFTAGGSVAISKNSTIEFAAMYAPTDRVTGIEVTPGGPNPGHNIAIEMKQIEFTVGWKMRFGK